MSKKVVVAVLDYYLSILKTEKVFGFLFVQPQKLRGNSVSRAIINMNKL